MIRGDTGKELGNTKIFTKHLSHLILIPRGRDFNMILRKIFNFFNYH